MRVTTENYLQLEGREISYEDNNRDSKIQLLEVPQD
jgi:hypothetical protein